MTKGLTCGAAVIILALARGQSFAADTICLAQGSWTCEGNGAIEIVERLDRLQHEMDKSGIKALNEGEFKRLVEVGRCEYSLARSAVTVMSVDGRFAYICDDIRSSPTEDHFYSCTYALVSDLSDTHGQNIPTDQLRRTAARHTMGDVQDIVTCEPSR